MLSYWFLGEKAPYSILRNFTIVILNMCLMCFQNRGITDGGFGSSSTDGSTGLLALFCTRVRVRAIACCFAWLGLIRLQVIP